MSMSKFLRSVAAVLAIALCAVCAQAEDEAKVRVFDIGGRTVTSIVDSYMEVTLSLFEGIENKPELAALMPGGKAKCPDRVYLMREGNSVTLFDGGNGKFFLDPIIGDCVETLASLGVKVEDVDDIVMTHLDFDHVGGLVNKEGKAIFPKAKLHVSRVEFEAWDKNKGLTPNRSGKLLSLSQTVIEAYKGRINIFEFGDMVMPGVFALPATGHTPGHTIFRINGAKTDFLIAGDFIHYAPIQLIEPEFSTIWDDKIPAGITRRRILEWLCGQNIIMASGHNPIGYISRDNAGNLSLIPLP